MPNRKVHSAYLNKRKTGSVRRQNLVLRRHDDVRCIKWLDHNHGSTVVMFEDLCDFDPSTVSRRSVDSIRDSNVPPVMLGLVACLFVESVNSHRPIFRYYIATRMEAEGAPEGA